MTLRFLNLTTGSSGLNIESLSIDTTDHAKTALSVLSKKIKFIDQMSVNLEFYKLILNLAVAHDATTISVDLNEEIFIVKRMDNYI